jgi:hypothetical protein
VHAEDWNVAAIWQKNLQRIVSALHAVVFLQFRAQSSSFDSNNGIGAGVERGRTAVRLGRYLVFLDRPCGILERALNHQRQKRSEPLTAAECLAGKKSLEVLSNQLATRSTLVIACL